MTEWLDALGIAQAVRSGRSSAAEATEAALRRIERENARYNCFTEVLAAQARRDAARVDADIAAGRDPGALAGAPFAVKNLFDELYIVDRTRGILPGSPRLVQAGVRLRF